MQSASVEHRNTGTMRAKEAAAFLAIAESTFWRWVAEGKLPRGIRLSTRCTVWRRESLEKVLEQAAEGAK